MKRKDLAQPFFDAHAWVGPMGFMMTFLVGQEGEGMKNDQKGQRYPDASSPSHLAKHRDEFTPTFSKNQRQAVSGFLPEEEGRSGSILSEVAFVTAFPAVFDEGFFRVLLEGIEPPATVLFKFLKLLLCLTPMNFHGPST